MEGRNHKHISYFSPELLSLEEAYNNYAYEVSNFDAGERFKNFNDFIKQDAFEYRDAGNGVTYTIWNVFYSELGIEIKRDFVAYYTLAASSMPYIDRIRKDESEMKDGDEPYDTQICGFPALEIKMFAVDQKYQDIFYSFEGQDIPVSAWILLYIEQQIEGIFENTLGFKIIFLHAVPSAENSTFKMDLIIFGKI